MCEISAAGQNLANVAKEAAFGFATLAMEPSFSGSASDSVMFLEVGIASRLELVSCFSSYAVAGDINVNRSSCLESVTSCVSRITW